MTSDDKGDKIITMTYRKKFIPHIHLRKALYNPRLDNQETEPKQDFADGSGFLAEMREIDYLADESIKSYAPTTN